MDVNLGDKRYYELAEESEDPDPIRPLLVESVMAMSPYFAANVCQSYDETPWFTKILARARRA